ncbi:hypothetical protein Godav_029939 [Gossypium davidsonii]|uniref:Uncharacterized protein n=1 Tax=Gossypium davidsonii TaxID=34287 RepID=A0A7J8TKQ6_GOSDV|nr:hypothetical protein [Gossypium davidsonii]
MPWEKFVEAKKNLYEHDKVFDNAPNLYIDDRTPKSTQEFSPKSMILRTLMTVAELSKSWKSNLGDGSLEMKEVKSSTKNSHFSKSNVGAVSTAERVKSFQTDEDPSCRVFAYLFFTTQKSGVNPAGHIQPPWDGTNCFMYWYEKRLLSSFLHNLCVKHGLMNSKTTNLCKLLHSYNENLNGYC